MPRGAKPGERRGGRAKGTLDKRTIGMRRAEAEAKAAAEEALKAKPPEMFQDRPGGVPDSLDFKREIVRLLMAMVIDERNKRNAGSPDYDRRWLKDILEAADRATSGLMPYEHRRLATLEPAMEAVIKPDGSFHVTISMTDSEL